MIYHRVPRCLLLSQRSLSLAAASSSRTLPHAAASSFSFAPAPRSVTLAVRAFSTPFDVFNDKERADESMWIARHEREYAEHLRLQKELEARRKKQKQQEQSQQEQPQQEPASTGDPPVAGVATEETKEHKV